MAASDDKFIPTRATLLSRLKDWDDQESWMEFFDTYSKMLYSVAIRSGLRGPTAEDLVQETIIAVAKNIPNFKYDPSRGSFKSWLLTIIRRRIIDHIRTVKREPPRQYPEESDRTPLIARIADPDGNQIDSIYEEEWKKSVFEAAVARVKRTIDPKQFQMFDVYALKEWPVEQVAKHLNVTPGQIYTAKSRVTALIKEEAQRLETTMI